ASSFSQYCGNACQAGLAYTVGPGDGLYRAGIGTGYADSPYTIPNALHEIGHSHGRQHAPCGGGNNKDPQFPYADGGVGAWGYDLLNGKLFSPNDTKDIMGYCEPKWMSDYTYSALLERIQLVNGASYYVSPEASNQQYERARIEPDGTL